MDLMVQKDPHPVSEFKYLLWSHCGTVRDLDLVQGTGSRSDSWGWVRDQDLDQGPAGVSLLFYF